jgi:hypothetical protein
VEYGIRNFYGVVGSGRKTAWDAFYFTEKPKELCLKLGVYPETNEYVKINVIASLRSNPSGAG